MELCWKGFSGRMADVKKEATLRDGKLWQRFLILLVVVGGQAETYSHDAGCFAVARDLRALLPNLLLGFGSAGTAQTDWL